MTPVLLVGGFPPPHGGISVHVQALFEALRARGRSVRVLDVGSGKPPQPGVVPVRSAAALASALAAHAAAGWLVHVHVSGHTPKSWMVALAGSLARRPFGPAPVLTVHSGLVPLFAAQGRAQRALVGRVASAYGRVVAVNETVAGALQACGVRASRIAVVPAFAGADLRAEPPAGLAALRFDFAPLVSCAVAPSPIYGLRVLLPALRLASLRRPSLGAALFGPEGTRPGRIEEAAKAGGLSGRVHYLGELGHAGALAVMAASDVFVRPTLADGDALSVREALSLGVPVVASAVGFRPPGVRLFRVGDERGLAEAIEAALVAERPAPVPPTGLEALLELYGEEGARAAG
ncbi:MAG TPA: glycosyltransferase family 4 protein [Myxococcales bacterium]